MELLSLPPALLAFLAAMPVVHAQSPPASSYDSILISPINPNVTVAYKEPTAGTCMTAFTTQKQYTGYIGIPPDTLELVGQNYSINTFFWFIEARQTPESAPLTVWLNGGPGASSMFGLFNEIGPCEVVQMLDGNYGTQMRTFGWDRASNVLFIDQPNLVGFSYDTLTNASLDLFANELYEPPTPPVSDLPAFMYLNGTFGAAHEGSSTISTANTTDIAAISTWHFLQTWLSTFKQYNPATRPNVTTPNSNEPAGINLFTESYGGKYGPAFATYFEEQNQAIVNGVLDGSTALLIKLESVGILNGLIDDLVQDYYYPMFAYNNTYGIEVIDQTTQLNSLDQFTNECMPAILACRAANPDVYGEDSQANALCESAQWTCNNLTALALVAGYNPYDIRQTLPSPDPPAAYIEYLNQGPVLSSIGARINYTESNPYVQQSFISTGDTIRGGMIDDLANLLKLGIRVALIYGDADWVCNWYGGQAVSFAIANALPGFPVPTSVSSTGAGVPPSYASGFGAAGFAKIVVNDSYVGGMVRQYGNLSFSVIYNAGHFVPFFQPEAAFQVFARVIFGNTITEGQPADLSTYGSTGDANITTTFEPPSQPEPTCWVRNWNSSCSEDETNGMKEGLGLVQYGIYYSDTKDITLPSTSVNAGVPGSPMETSSSEDGSSTAGVTLVALTGYYTATGTPTNVAAQRPSPPLDVRIWPALVVVVGALCGTLVMI